MGQWTHVTWSTTPPLYSLPPRVLPPTSLRSPYAMSGTDLAHGSGISLRARYAVSGTDLAYATMRWAATRSLCRVR
eukprot:465425-Rhodomonas_salina.2